MVVIAGPSPKWRSAHEFKALCVATELARKFVGELFGEKRVVEYKHKQSWEEGEIGKRKVRIYVDGSQEG